jgi:uncharacterized membrane protein YccC
VNDGAKVTVDFRQSLITGVSCWLATMAAFALHLDNPWWAAISAWVISSPDKSAFWQKGIMRILGTIAGCVLGYALAAELEGRPVAQAISFFLLGFGAAYLRFRSKFGYAWFIGILAALLLMSLSLSAPQSLYYFAHYRAYEIVCGVGSATLCHGILGVILRLEGAVNREPKETAPRGDQKEILSVALVGGLTAVIIPVLWSWFNLPSLPQSLVTVIVLVNPNLEATRFMGLQRILGCLLGGVLGLVASLCASESILLWSALFIFGIAGFSRLHFSESRWAYTGTQSGLAFIIAIVTGNGPPDTIVPVVNRIAGIMLGVLVFMSVAAVVRLWQTSLRRSQILRDL